jgi:hypothetical protein
LTASNVLKYKEEKKVERKHTAKVFFGLVGQQGMVTRQNQ